MSKTQVSEGLINQVRRLLEEGLADEALKVIERSGNHSAAAENAKGVCLMRLGQADKAAMILREIVFPNSSICIGPDIPVSYQINYATAMVMSGKVYPAIEVLSQIHDKKHPAVRQLKSAIKSWKKSLSIGERIMMFFCKAPAKHANIDFAPGLL